MRFPLRFSKRSGTRPRRRDAIRKLSHAQALTGDASLAILKDEFGMTPEIPDPTKHLQEHGAEIARPSPAQIKAFKKTVSAVRTEWEKRIGEEIMSAARADLEGSE